MRSILTAIVTPLASIIGSGFLLLAPLLDRSFGVVAGPVILLLCFVAYLLGMAMRYNIDHYDRLSETPATILVIERIASASLAFAYVISATYYRNLFGAFGVRLTVLNEPIYARGLATITFWLLGIYGVIKGLKGLEKIKTLAVSLKLAIIAGLLVGLMLYFGHLASTSALHLSVVQVTGWPTVTLTFGMLITVQGFETSHYLGSEYTAQERIRSMRWAQIYLLDHFMSFDHRLWSLNRIVPQRHTSGQCRARCFP